MREPYSFGSQMAKVRVSSYRHKYRLSLRPSGDSLVEETSTKRWEQMSEEQGEHVADLGLGAAGVGLAKEAIVRVAPSIWGKAKMWWQGDLLLVLGPERAGKTSFMNYLQYGVLRVEQDTA